MDDATTMLDDVAMKGDASMDDFDGATAKT
jgi:hypothetical protein